MNGVAIVREICPVCQGTDLVDRLQCFACKGDGLPIPTKSRHEMAMERLADDVVKGIDKRRCSEDVAWRVIGGGR